MKNIEKYNKFVQTQNRVEITNDNSKYIYPTIEQTKWINKKDAEKQCQINPNYSILMKMNIDKILGREE